MAEEQTSRKRVAVLISGRGSNLAALAAAADDPAYPAAIALVVSNRPNAAGLAIARARGIETAVVDHTTHGKDRAAFERVLQEVLERHRIDLVCLGGFMRLFTPQFVALWEGRMLNIHPALLPSFKGLDTHAHALEAGVRIHGATVHFVVPEMDAGPIVIQAAVPVLDDDTPDSLAARVVGVEHRIYPLALRWLAEGRLRRVGGRCRVDGVPGAGAVLIHPQASPSSR